MNTPTLEELWKEFEKQAQYNGKILSEALLEIWKLGYKARVKEEQEPAQCKYCDLKLAPRKHWEIGKPMVCSDCEEVLEIYGNAPAKACPDTCDGDCMACLGIDDASR